MVDGYYAKQEHTGIMTPTSVRRRTFSPLRSLARHTLDLFYEVPLHATMRPAPGPARVYYGWRRVPSLAQYTHGGVVKIQHMQGRFPNTPVGYNTIYLVSSQLPKQSMSLVRPAKRNKVALVLNQNGVAYPAWHGPGWERANKPMARLLHAAEYVFYQSGFCRRSADRFIGPRHGPSEVLHNPVDTDYYRPRAKTDQATRPSGLTLLLGGNQYQAYRLRSALEILAEVRRRRDDVRLMVAGDLSWLPDRAECKNQAEAWVNDLRLHGCVHWLGPYTQSQALGVYQSADILIHTKYNDPCPGVVLEAMACGLPVVYSASGGVPELVGESAGLGVPIEQTWDRDIPPDPVAFARAVMAVADDLPSYSAAARGHAERRFHIKSWLDRHQEVFDQLHPQAAPVQPSVP